MAVGNALLYPILDFASRVAFLYVSFGNLTINYHKEPEMGFVTRNETRFMLDGKALYVKGWNSYWLMDHDVHDYSRHSFVA